MGPVATNVRVGRHLSAPNVADATQEREGYLAAWFEHLARSID